MQRFVVFSSLLIFLAPYKGAQSFVSYHTGVTEDVFDLEMPLVLDTSKEKSMNPPKPSPKKVLPAEKKPPARDTVQRPKTRKKKPESRAESKTPAPRPERKSTTSRAPIDSRKKAVDQLLANSCQKIKAQKHRLSKKRMVRATNYYTPLFRPSSSGGLRSNDRRSCIMMEGSCVVGKWMYNYAGKGRPWGKRWERSQTVQKFGKGSGGPRVFNRTNALDPCRTVAASHKHHKRGSVLFFPSMVGKICPQSGKPIDGCFIVSDTGSPKHFNRTGRFDFFAGECINYNKRTSVCEERLVRNFKPPARATYYDLGRNHPLAKELRKETDRHIRRDWKTPATVPSSAVSRELASGAH